MASEAVPGFSTLGQEPSTVEDVLAQIMAYSGNSGRVRLSIEMAEFFF
jgi:hypothetical protein